MEDYPCDLLELEARFSTEAECRGYLCRLRWPEGFRCPRCSGTKNWPKGDGLVRCADCDYQVSVTAGTVFQDSHLPLILWFRAVWWVTSQKNGVSAMGLQRVLGLKSYKTAWTMLHKLRHAMVRPGRDRLQGHVEVDEAFVGGEEEGVHGRQTETKAMIAVAVEEDGDGIGRIRMRRIPDASAESLMPFIEDSVEPGSLVHTDGWLGYHPLKGQRLPAPGHLPEEKQQKGFGTDAACSSGGRPAQALAAGNPSRWSEPGASGCLSRRVHIQVQPSQIAQPRQTLLPLTGAGRHCRATPLQISGQISGIAALLKPQYIGVTGVK